ncbi:MAG: urease accessory protein UreD, partial [Lachnospiraceae bacterium]|nr:urease accessory protein UreD [Lachnospiraceae bacterium]
LYTDIVTAGRVGMGERFAFRHYHNRICIRINKKPIWIDNCLLNPMLMDMENILFFDGYTHMGTLYYFCPDEKSKVTEKIRQLGGRTFENMTVGASSALKGICLRVLAHSAQDIEELFQILT